MKIAALLIGAASALALVPAPRASDEGPRFMLGILRRDGIISPFASFDGSGWSAPWPATLRYLDLPFSLGAVPRKWWGRIETPSAMTVWSEGTNGGSVRLERPTQIRPMCSTRLALRSSYKSPHSVPSSIERPYPKDGLAITGDQAIEPIEILTPSSPEWIPTALLLLDAFSKAEQTAAAAFTEWKHPLSREQRARVPLELETIYKAPMDEPGWTAYHVEAVKRYDPGPGDDGCGAVTSVSGWVRAGRGGTPSVTLYRADVTYCERAGASFVLPLGLVRTGGRNYWVYQVSGFEREYYVVARPVVDSVKVMIDYEAGVCPR